MADPGAGGLVLVTGATGALGPVVVSELWRQGYRVRTLSRDAPLTPFPGATDVREGDVTDAAAVTAAVEGTCAIVHLAARLHLQGAAAHDEAAYERVNIGGTETVVDCARAAGARRVVFASTIAVYGQSVPEPATEATEPRPDSAYSRTKLRAEQVVRAATGSDGTPLGTVLRLAAVYGPGVKGNYRRLITALDRGLWVPIGAGDNRRTLIHVEDVARAMIHVLRTPGAAGRTLNVSDGAMHTTNDIVAAICAALGRPVPRWHVPRGAALGLAALGDLARIAAGRGASWKEQVARYTDDVAVDGSRLQQEFGFRPQWHLRDGWADVIRSMRAAGELRQEPA